MAKLKDIGELDLIAGFSGEVGQPGKRILKGIGDDCAVIDKVSESLLLTTDIMIEGTHFLSENPDPQMLAEKLLAVNLSDIAAMGGRAFAGLLTIALNPETDLDFWERFSGRLAALCSTRDLDIIGGDTSSTSGPLSLNLMLLGKAVDGKIVYRSGAAVGDLVYASRALGDSAAGLYLLKNPGLDIDQAVKAPLVDAHLMPKAEEELGPILAETGLVSSMIDVSDGLATDLGHLTRASGLGAEIDIDQVPVSEEAAILAGRIEADPKDWALQGGEDYALIFTMPASVEKQLRETVRDRLDRSLYKIGRTVNEKGLYVLRGGRREPLQLSGFEHFRNGE